MTIVVKIEPTVRAGEHTSHFVAVFHFDGKNFVDSGKRLHVGVNGAPNQVGEEPLYSEGRAVLLVEGWGDGSTESGERCPDIIPIIDAFQNYPKPQATPENVAGAGGSTPRPNSAVSQLTTPTSQQPDPKGVEKLKSIGMYWLDRAVEEGRPNAVMDRQTFTATLEALAKLKAGI